VLLLAPTVGKLGKSKQHSHPNIKSWF
jgi:hypothetical protein